MKKPNFIFILSIIFLFNINSYSQSIPYIEWQRSYQPTTHPTNSNLAGQDEDWFYDIKPSFTGGKQDGYIACGYTEYLNYPTPPPYPYPGSNKDIVERYTELMSTQLQKGAQMHKIVKLDLNGNVIWYKIADPIYLGYLHKIIQLTDGSYIAVGYVINNITKYNPTVSDPTGQTEITNGSSKARHSYVAKYDINGNKLWDFQYGLEDDITKTFPFQTKAWGVVETEDNNIIISTEDLKSSIFYENKCDNIEHFETIRLGLIKINTTNGQIIWKQDYGHDTDGNPVVTFGTSINKKDNKYVVTANQMDHNFCKNANDFPPLHVFVMTFTNSSVAPDPFTSSQRYMKLSTSNSDIVTDATIDNDNNVLIPVIHNTIIGVYNAHGEDGALEIHKLNFNTLNTIQSITAPVTSVTAYDSKAGICSTSDGGFAVTTSIKDWNWHT